MEIETIKLLLDVARLGSFAGAARARDVDPSWVSRTISEAERVLGVRLFQRTTRRLSVTETGEKFVQRMAPVIEEIERIIEAARHEQAEVTGTIRLAASVAFGQTCLVPLLGRFRAAFPNLRLELVLSDANADLVRERIDLAIRLGPDVDGNVICAKLCPTRYRVCASPAYLAKAPPLRRPQDLDGHQSLVFALGDYRSRWLFRNANGHVVEVPINGSFVISNALGLRTAALDGLGPVLLANWLIDPDIAAGRLIDLFPSHDVTATTFDTAAWLIYPSRAFLPARVRQTIGFLRQHLAG